MFEGFVTESIDVGETTIFLRHAGEGSPLLLLHGFPQTHLMWRRIAPGLVRDFTVVCADLRGYGQSGCPSSAPDHAPYAKRAMAADMVKAMARLGFDRFAVAGHGRGGRVAYRMALGAWGSDPRTFPPAVRAAYVDALRVPEHVHAICEEYRAAASLDRAHDAADVAAGRRIICPVLALWSDQGGLATWYAGEGGPMALWRSWAEDVRGCAIRGGHFFPEEAREETAAALRGFFALR